MFCYNERYDALGLILSSIVKSFLDYLFTVIALNKKKENTKTLRDINL